MVRYWSESGVRSEITFVQNDVIKSSVITGDQLQVFKVYEGHTIRDIEAFTMFFKYSHTRTIGNESSLHFIVEYL